MNTVPTPIAAPTLAEQLVAEGFRRLGTAHPAEFDVEVLFSYDYQQFVSLRDKPLDAPRYVVVKVRHWPRGYYERSAVVYARLGYRYNRKANERAGAWVLSDATDLFEQAVEGRYELPAALEALGRERLVSLHVDRYTDEVLVPLAVLPKYARVLCNRITSTPDESAVITNHVLVFHRDETGLDGWVLASIR